MLMTILDVRIKEICLHNILTPFSVSVIIVARTSLIFADLLVLGVTWVHTYRKGIQGETRATLSQILLRDGKVLRTFQTRGHVADVAVGTIYFRYVHCCGEGPH